MSDGAAAPAFAGRRAGQACRSVRKYAAIFHAGIKLRLAYPLDLMMSGISVVLFLWIFVHLWRATYRTTGQDVVAGFTLRDILWYLMLTEAVVLSRSQVFHNIAASVRSGSIATFLVRPHGFVLYNAAFGLADSAFRFALNLVAGGAVVWWAVGPPPNPGAWPVTLLAVAMAWIIDFCISALIALGTFLVEDVSAFQWIYHKALLILGGTLIPLEFMPDWLRSVSLALPFAYMSYVPARLFVAPDPLRLGGMLAGQALWAAGLGLLLGLAYRRCVVRLTVNGG